MESCFAMSPCGLNGAYNSGSVDLFFCHLSLLLRILVAVASYTVRPNSASRLMPERCHTLPPIPLNWKADLRRLKPAQSADLTNRKTTFGL